MSELLPCPFCGSKNIDAQPLASADRDGPACDDCGGTADTVELWNSRPAQCALPQQLSGEIACILEDCNGPEFQSPEALAELIRHYQPTWDRIVAAVTSTDGGLDHE